MNVIRLHSDKPVTAANLVWENPPERNRRTGKYADFAQALRENPDRWAVIATFPADQKKRGWALSNTINSGKLIDFPAREFQALCRTGNGETRVYVQHCTSTVIEAVQA